MEFPNVRVHVVGIPSFCSSIREVSEFSKSACILERWAASTISPSRVLRDPNTP